MVILVEFALAALLLFANVVLCLFRGTRIELSCETPGLGDELDRVARW
jgi:hypothetical protein